MTKKEQILETALSLFAMYGFHAVSTARIAREAKVSEGLIFRHFKSKKGLLESILSQMETKIATMFSDLFATDDPKQVIKKMIEANYAVDENEYDFWRLSFKLKWDIEFYRPEQTKPLLKRLTWAFKELGYKKPKIEAEILFQNIESIAIQILRDGKKSTLKYKSFLLKKYL